MMTFLISAVIVIFPLWRFDCMCMGEVSVKVLCMRGKMCFEVDVNLVVYFHASSSN